MILVVDLRKAGRLVESRRAAHIEIADNLTNEKEELKALKITPPRSNMSNETLVFHSRSTEEIKDVM